MKELVKVVEALSRKVLSLETELAEIKPKGTNSNSGVGKGPGLVPHGKEKENKLENDKYEDKSSLHKGVSEHEDKFVCSTPKKNKLNKAKKSDG